MEHAPPAFVFVARGYRLGSCFLMRTAGRDIKLANWCNLASKPKFAPNAGWTLDPWCDALHAGRTCRINTLDAQRI